MIACVTRRIIATRLLCEEFRGLCRERDVEKGGGGGFGGAAVEGLSLAQNLL